MDKDSDKASRVGLYTTISFHLIILIILIVISIREIAVSESSFVLDFTREEQIEEIAKLEQLKNEAQSEVDELLSSRSHSNVRNVAIDASGENLKDDRNSNPSEIYQEARELQAKLDASRREAMSQEKSEDVVDVSAPTTHKKTDDKQSAYQGPSVISYKLDGRKAKYLPVPAYKGYGGGDVTVEIIVNPNGTVTSATIIEAASTKDSSLWEYAIEAAKRSRFAASASAPAKMTGQIVYRFIAQ